MACEIQSFELPYDQLIVTVGASTNTFGVKGVKVRARARARARARVRVRVRVRVAHCIKGGKEHRIS